MRLGGMMAMKTLLLALALLCAGITALPCEGRQPDQWGRVLCCCPVSGGGTCCGEAAFCGGTVPGCLCQ